MKAKLAIIQFPGSNCEYETQTACRHYGISADIIRWNESPQIVRSYSGYILPGGFSYQDRVRSGAIASKLPIISELIAASDQNKPILGICNGCQILAEAGLFPDTQHNKTVQVALGHNEHVAPTGARQKMGFICDWVTVKISNPHHSVFTRYFSQDDTIPIPINHGEGLFIIEDPASISTLTHITYCTPSGETVTHYPTNPNGSQLNTAGLSNAKGNVLALMPHPERAAFLKQIPSWIDSEWGEKKRNHHPQKNNSQTNSQSNSQTKHQSKLENGPWEPLFIALKDALSGHN